MYEFWYDYVKPKYGENEKLCYMDRKNFIVHVKTNDIYKDIGEDVETRFDTSNFELGRPLLKGKNKKVTGLMKDERWTNERCTNHERIMIEFVGLRAKTYSYLSDNNHEDKKPQEYVP